MKFRVPTLPVLPVLLMMAAPSSHAGPVESAMNQITGPICGAVWKGLQLEEVRNRQAVFADRFLYPWVGIEPLLQARKMPFEIAQDLMRLDARSSLIQAEEQTKFYAHDFGDTSKAKGFTKMTEQIKDFEDALGFAVDSAKLPIKLGKIGFSNKTLLEAQKRAAAGLEALVRLLKEQSWIGQDAKALQTIVNHSLQVPAPTQLEDAKIIQKLISDQTDFILERLRNRGKVTLEEAPKWAKDANGNYRLTLEGFAHAFKRELRKFQAFKRAARGKIRTVRWMTPPKSLEPYQDVPEADREFMQAERSPFPIKHAVFYNEAAENALAIFIERLNTLKDNGELEELAIEMTLKSGEYPDRQTAKAAVRAKIRAAKPKWLPWEEQIEALLAEIESSGVLEQLLVRRESLPPEVLQRFESADYRP